MSKKPDKEDGGHALLVTAEQCLERVNAIRGDIKEVKRDVEENKMENKRIVTVLVGKDMKTGLVGEIKDIKASLRTQNSWISVIKPIVIALITTAVTAYLLKGVP